MSSSSLSSVTVAVAVAAALVVVAFTCCYCCVWGCLRLTGGCVAFSPSPVISYDTFNAHCAVRLPACELLSLFLAFSVCVCVFEPPCLWDFWATRCSFKRIIAC